MKKHRRPLLLLGGLLCALAVYTVIAYRAYQPAIAGPQLEPPVPKGFTCENAPGSLTGQVHGVGAVLVKQFIYWSGCNTWECWTDWWNRGPAALYEYQSHECWLNSDEDNTLCVAIPESGSPPNAWTSDIYHDPRNQCDTDGDRILEDAAGTWYHNSFAIPRPNCGYLDFSYVCACNWDLPEAVSYWNFAEDDVCLYRACEDPAPPYTATVCTWEETPIVHPTDPPPQPTPFIPNEPEAEGAAYVHSYRDPEHSYRTGNEFLWPWQHYLDISLDANMAPLSQAGCTTSSSVDSYFFKGSIGQEVCRGEEGDCRWRPTYLGSDPPDVTTPEWIHLLWSYSPSPPTANSASWNFSPVGPTWVDIQYSVTIHTYYYCGANTYEAWWPKDLSVRVGLTRTYRTR